MALRVGETGEKRKATGREGERENSGPSRSYTGMATARDDNMLRATKSSQNKGERERERGGRIGRRRKTADLLRQYFTNFRLLLGKIK